MFTYMTRLGLWRTAIDLHPEDLLESIVSAKEVLDYLMGDERPLHHTDFSQDMIDAIDAWTEHEHALANYGAVMQHQMIGAYPVHADPKIGTWFSVRQRQIRSYGWPYSRPAWATDVNVLTAHREKLLKLRPYWYEPRFDMTPREHVYNASSHLGVWPDRSAGGPRLLDERGGV